MRLYRRKPGGSWWVDYADENGARRRRSTKTRDKQAAELVASELVRSVALRRAGVMAVDRLAAREPLESLVDRWIGPDHPHGSEQRISRLRMLRAASDRGWQTVADITPESIRAHLEGLSCSDQTRARVHDVIRRFCDWCMRSRPPTLGTNPADHVDRPRYVKERTRYALPAEHAIALLAAPPRSGRGYGVGAWLAHRLAYRLALDAGLRRSDARRLTIAQVRLSGVRPWIELPATKTKTRRNEGVALTAELATELEHWIAQRRCQTANTPDALVVSLDGVRPNMPSCPSLRKDLRRIGLPDHDPYGNPIDFHTLRQTFITRFAWAGMHTRLGQVNARHSSARTTQEVYLRAGYLEGAEALVSLPSLGPARIS